MEEYISICNYKCCKNKVGSNLDLYDLFGTKNFKCIYYEKQIHNNHEEIGFVW